MKAQADFHYPVLVWISIYNEDVTPLHKNQLHPKARIRSQREKGRSQRKYALLNLADLRATARPSKIKTSKTSCSILRVRKKKLAASYQSSADNPKKIFRLLCRLHLCQLRFATLGGSPSPATTRKLSATLGGSTSTRPWVRKLTLKTCDFIDVSSATIPATLGGSTTASPPIMIVILRQQLDYVIVNYAAPTTPHPIKAKFSSSKNRLLFTFAAPNTRGLRHEKSSCISLTSKNCESPSSWRSLSNT
jgi:hypothetical protein